MFDNEDMFMSTLEKAPISFFKHVSDNKIEANCDKCHLILNGCYKKEIK